MPAESNAVRPAAAPVAPQPPGALAVASTAPTVSATSYAEAASPGTGAGGVAAEDHTALIIVCAIGATAFIIAIGSARIAIGR
jgi:hypothetical protein